MVILPEWPRPRERHHQPFPTPWGKEREVESGSDGAL